MNLWNLNANAADCDVATTSCLLLPPNSDVWNTVAVAAAAPAMQPTDAAARGRYKSIQYDRDPMPV